MQRKWKRQAWRRSSDWTPLDKQKYYWLNRAVRRERAASVRLFA